MKSAEFKFDIAEKVRQSKRILKQHTTQTFLINSRLFPHIYI